MNTHLRTVITRRLLTFKKSTFATEAATNQIIPPPTLDNEPKNYPTKILDIVNQISALNLIEVADLNQCLRQKLNIKDVPMNFGAMGGMPTAAQQPKEEVEEEPELPKAVKTSFKLKIVKYDETKKISLIKEMKVIDSSMNLVQAKKFIESVPQVFRENIPKDEAEKLKEQIEKAGGVCEIE
jgi:large subunit ribosomal protein L7/L12